MRIPSHVIHREIEGLQYQFTKKPKSLPIVLSSTEVQSILKAMEGKYWLITALLYGSGLRISEALSLRVKDIDLKNRSIFIFRGKGAKDRYTLLPEALTPHIRKQIEATTHLHGRDIAEGFGYTSVPPALQRKYKNTLKDLAWQYLFPSSTRCVHPYDGYVCRHPIHPTAYAKQLRMSCSASHLNF